MFSDSKNDQLNGELDLGLLFDPVSAQTLINSVGLHGSSVAQDSHIACATIGNPKFDDAEADLAAKDSGAAAGLLKAWHKHGINVTSRISGSYAFTIVDADKGCVFLAVDRFAEQTLCYCLEGNQLSVSDRADCVVGRGDELDPQAIFDFLYFHMIPAPRTIFSKVRRLPAAHALLIDKTGVKEIRHWQADFDEQHREPFAAAKDRFLNLIRESVSEQIENEPRVGAFLSGGTDSSTVAGMLCKITGEPAPAYSIGFDAKGFDEMEYARIAARHFGCKLHEYYVTPADVLASLPAIATHHDQPFGNSSALPAYYCTKMAKADGCTKMLAGDGGDELFGGNSRYATQRLFELYHGLPHGFRQMIEPFCGDESLLRRIPGLRQVTGYVRHSRTPMPDRMQSFNLIMHLDPAKVIAPGLLSQIDFSGPQNHMRDTWKECHASSLINRMLAYDWRYTLADSDLPKVRGASSMAGIPVGYPLLSDRLTDFSMSLHPEWKVRQLKLRWFFKEALRGFLPDAILTKKKKGFGLPFGVWSVNDPALKKLSSKSLYGLAERGLIREDFVEQLLDQHLPDHPSYYGEMVWILIILEQWLRSHVPNYTLSSAPHPV
ncbi:asparagine synthetase B family protein [Propionivibrio sp.]|uniref:asparagine synthetase B family protein n=1 Tax=Propionivibrio sp. TaxID=2212460 RepID=UPI003BEF8294